MLVIVGIVLSVIVVSSTPNPRRQLNEEAYRLSLLFQTAQEDAELQRRPTAWEGDLQGYAFSRLPLGSRTWEPIDKDDLLRKHVWTRSLTFLQLKVAGASVSPRIVFGKESIQEPFSLTLERDNTSVVLSSDGAGHYTVE